MKSVLSGLGLWPEPSPAPPPEFSPEALRRRHLALKNHLRHLSGARDLAPPSFSALPPVPAFLAPADSTRQEAAE